MPTSNVTFEHHAMWQPDHVIMLIRFVWLDAKWAPDHQQPQCQLNSADTATRITMYFATQILVTRNKSDYAQISQGIPSLGSISVKNTHLNYDVIYTKRWQILKLGNDDLKLDLKLLLLTFFLSNRIHGEIDHWDQRQFDYRTGCKFNIFFDAN